MRFRFCGDLDCPDWILSAIATLTKMTSVKMKLLCAQVMKQILGGQLDYSKVQKLTSDAKFDTSDIKAGIACLSFILTSGVKNNVNPEVLSNELQQLGLPKEHSTALCKVYAEGQENIHEKLREESLRLSRLQAVDWRVDYVLASSHLETVEEPSVNLKLTVSDPDTDSTTPVTFTVGSEKFRVLLAELKQAQSLLEKKLVVQ